MKFNDLMGKKFGKLLVIERELPNDSSNNIRWKCQCDCGEIVIIRGGNLTDNRTKSCGCYHRDKVRKQPYYHIYSALKRRKKYAKWNSKKKEVKFTFQEFLKFVSVSNCHYCGETIRWEMYSGRFGNRHHLNLDRKDNSIGYTVDNCVVCCPRCNRMKGTLSYEEFYEFTRPIREVL